MKRILPDFGGDLTFDLGEVYWTLGFTIGLSQRPREVRILSGNMVRLEREIAESKRRFGLPSDAIVVSCYEAGRDGFWLHRWLEAHHVQNAVVDSSSIEVNRRQRRSKTDRLDVGKLLKLLVRFHQMLRRTCYLLLRSDCYQLERLVDGWELHPLEIAAFHGAQFFDRTGWPPESDPNCSAA